MSKRDCAEEAALRIYEASIGLADAEIFVQAIGDKQLATKIMTQRVALHALHTEISNKLEDK